MVQMGLLQTSKNQDLLMSYSTNMQAKGKHEGKDPKSSDSKPKDNQTSFEGASGSKKKKKFEKTRCPYCTRGFHSKIQCMEKKIDQLSTLLEQNNIFLPQEPKKSDVGQLKEDHERCHALKVGFTQ